MEILTPIQTIDLQTPPPNLISEDLIASAIEKLKTLSDFKSQDEFHIFLSNLGKQLFTRYEKFFHMKKETSEGLVLNSHILDTKVSQNGQLLQNKSDTSSEPVSTAEQPNLVCNEINQEQYYSGLIKSIGEDVMRQGLLKTPYRAAKALRELTIGYTQDLNIIVNDAIYDCKGKEMVVVKDIEIYSLCEHHLLPFLGKCHVGYIPNGKVIGLSKIARIVDLYARRLQIQENLTQEIADALKKVIDAEGVAVIMEAEHLCMRMRGVGKQNSVMQTSTMLGTFDHDKTVRAEFLTLINRK